MIAALAAAVAVVGAAVLRRWDAQAGKTVADLSRARVSDEWRYEERVAELETDLEESRELRGKLEQRLRAKRAELAGLRNEHAALLRRYANAETERASALEGRRRLELEALTPGAVEGEGAETESAGAAEVAGSAEAVAVEPSAPGLFSPEGSKLFLRAAEALGRFERPGAVEGDSPEGAAEAVEAGVAKEAVKGGADGGSSSAEGRAGDVLSKGGSPQGGSPKGGSSVKGDVPSGGGSPEGDGPKGDGPEGGEPVAEDEGEGKTKAADAQGHAVAGSTGREDRYEALRGGVSEANGIPARDGASQESTSAALDVRTRERDVPARGTDAVAEPMRGTVEIPQQPAHALEPAHATGIPQQTSTSGEIVRRPAGHFAVPTAVAVVPGEPVRRPAIEGGFDFFGTQQDAEPAALEAVQNEDLADVVGQEALALHKAEAEAEFKPADETSRAVGQVVDLTSHDETEQLDLQGLRSAAY